MFCNNCGSQLQDGQRFCANCGAEQPQTAPAVCEKCGNKIVEGAKFCNVCGTPVAGKKAMFCPYCGQKFEEGETFCAKCGNKLPVKAAPKTVQGSGAGENAVTRWFANTGSPILTPFGNMMAIKQLIMAVLVLFLLIFSIFPAFDVYGIGVRGVSMLNIWRGFDLIGNELMVLFVLGSIVEIAILLGLMGVAILPVYKNEWYNNLILLISSMVLTGGRFIFCLIWLIFFNAEYYTAKITFAGVMYIIFSLVACLYSVYLFFEQKKLQQR